MAFYDNYHASRSSELTPIGYKIVTHWNSYFIKKIMKFTKGKPISINLVEIGPGKGYFAKQAQKRGFQYLAIEGNQHMSAKLKKENLKVITSLVPPLKLKNPVDVVFMDQVFEHMTDWKTATRLLQDCKKHLKKEGIVIISCPDIEYWKSDFFVSDYTHTFPTSQRTLKQISHDNDFTILESGVYTFFTTKTYFCKLIAESIHLLYSLGLIQLIFKDKAYKIKSSLLPSCYVILQNSIVPPKIKDNN